MDYETFLIADFKSGLETDKAPWLLPSDAFSEIQNAYVHHGVIKKRGGYLFWAEMIHQKTTITAISNADPGVVTVAAAAGLAEGQEVQINYATGGSFSSLNGRRYVITNLVGLTFQLYDTDGNSVDTTTYGAFGSAVLCIFPQLPIMGIKQFVQDSVSNPTFVWDTKRMGVYNGTINSIDPIDTADIFTGDNSNFISVGYFGTTSAFSTPTMFFTNYNGRTDGVVDNMRSYTSGTTSSTFIPQITSGGDTVETAQFIHSLKQRLILFNTVEKIGGINTYYQQRMRWSKALNPEQSLANWDQDTRGAGGYVDAPTSDTIVSTKYLSDQIIVFFTNSVWRVLPTSDPALPFRWDKINNFRTSDSPYGTLNYDRFITSFGKRGIFACDGIQVTRVDNKIEDFVLDEVNLTSINKVFSERNYVNRRSWTLYPSSLGATASGSEQTSSDRALIRQDEDSSFSVYTTQIIDGAGTLQNLSCLGFGDQYTDYAFDDFTGVGTNPPEYSFDDPEIADLDFQSFYTQEDAELLIAGDQIGRMFITERGTDDNGEPIEMSLFSASWNPYKDRGQQAQFGFIDIYADSDYSAKLNINFYKDDGEYPYKTQSTYLLPKIGFIADIQNVQQTNPCIVEAWDHGLSTGDIIYIYALKGMDELMGGPYVVTNIDQASFSLDNVDATSFVAYESGGKVTENPFVATKCWKRIYAGGVGYSHFVEISSSGIGENVNIHALQAGFRPTGTRVTA